MKCTLYLVCLLLFAGCSFVNVDPMKTREEWLINTSHFFENKSTEEVLVASEKLFLMISGPDYIKIMHAPEKIIATRDWGVFAIIASSSGRWTFEFVTTPVENGTKANLMISGTTQSSSSMTYTPSGLHGIGISGGNSYSPSEVFPYPQVYDLFWRRMDSLLFDKDWISCTAYLKSGEFGKPGGGTIGPLCFQAADRSPENVILDPNDSRYGDLITPLSSTWTSDVMR